MPSRKANHQPASQERIIEASLRSLGTDRAPVEQVFLFLACLPEDASVPKAVFDALAPTLVARSAPAQKPSSERPVLSSIDLAQMRHQLHTWLSRLVQLFLVRGSAHEGPGALADGPV